MIRLVGDDIIEIETSGENIENNILNEISGDLVYTLYEDEEIGKLPYINIQNCNEVDEINNKFSRIKKEIDAGTYEVPPESEKYDYKYFLNNNILSVVIHNMTALGAATYTYTVYNIDITNGKLISNTELLKIANVSENEIFNMLPEIYRNEFIEYSCIQDGVLTREEANNLINGQPFKVDVSDEEHVKELYDNSINLVLSDINDVFIYMGENGKIEAVAHEVLGIVGSVK